MSVVAAALAAFLLAQGEGQPPAAQALEAGKAPQAQPPQAAAPPGPLEVESVETQADEAHQIGLILRCPVCQGMPIAESPSRMAQAMMVRVREMLAEGLSRQEILDYFTAKYGEWVLLEPKAQGMNLGLWILPAVALLIGAVFVVRSARKPGPAEPRSEPTEPETEDEFVRAIRDEVNQ